MDKNSSYNNAEAARLVKVKHQKNRINQQIKAAEKASIFEITFFEELYPENKTYLQNAGYKVTTHGGPQSRFYSTIDWLTPNS